MSMLLYLCSTINKFHTVKSIFVNSESQEMWIEEGRWQLLFLSPFNRAEH